MTYEPYLEMNVLISEGYVPYFEFISSAFLFLVIAFVLINLFVFYLLIKRAFAVTTIKNKAD